MLFRLLTTALCAVCVVLLATLPRVRIEVLPPAAALPPVPAPCLRDRCAPPLTVVDVAAGVDRSRIMELLHLGPGERITAIDDRAVDEDLPPGVPIDPAGEDPRPAGNAVGVPTPRLSASPIAELAPRPGGFLDLTVSSPSAERRVLVLLHRAGAPLTP
ncbi:MAG TPA: hypothetical protein VF469_35930 [Kofleriaceae bacterium]